MSDQTLAELLSKLVNGYSHKGELKELCISLQKPGELTIGARKMLISEIEESQPYEETIGCIQVIFASSSGSTSFDEKRDNNDLTNELQKMLISKKNGNKFQEQLARLLVKSLVSVAPMLKKITFENK